MAEHELFDIPNVVGFGRGWKIQGDVQLDQQAVVVLVIDKLPKTMLSERDLIPSRVELTSLGLVGQTDVREVGTLRALRTGRLRPAPGGVSIGHKDITAGTLGVIVTDRETDEFLILSNNHVLANSNAAKVGDAILQPGPIDGGRLGIDTIAVLHRFVKIAFEGGCNLFAKGGPNLVDAAVALPLNDMDVLPEILDIGAVVGWTPARLDQAVQKSGRTTALTVGSVQVIDAVVKVSYGSSGTAIFERQILTSNMSKGGDSGSLLVDAQEDTAVGLLFAGSDQVTIHNPIDEVLSALAVII